MAGQGRDDREAIDRAFAEMIAGYHLTADPVRADRDLAERDRTGQELDDHQLTDRGPDTDHQTDPDREPPETGESEPPRPGESDRAGGKDRGRSAGSWIDLDSRWADEHPLFSFIEPGPEPEPEPVEERFEPGEPPPWPRPSAAVLVGWIGVGFAVLTMIAAALGAPVARWVAWTAIGGFVGGFALLLSRLPKHRPPGSGDGAVL